jgi:hypothetical protein
MTPDLGRPTHLVIPSPGTSIECDEGSVRRYLVAERRLGYASVLLSIWGVSPTPSRVLARGVAIPSL